MLDMLPYLMIVLCCAQLPMGIAIGVLYERHGLPIKRNEDWGKKKKERKPKGVMAPTSELSFDDVE